MKTERKKFSLKDWFFTTFTKPPAKREKPNRFSSLSTDEYANENGRIDRKAPRKFRRGRIVWSKGQMVKPITRFKLWSR